MRRVLSDATGEWQSVSELATRELEDRYVTRRAAVESYRRAVKRLAAEGLVELGYQKDATEWALRHRPELREPSPEPDDSWEGRQRLVMRRKETKR